MARAGKSLPIHEVNGWIIERRPNTFVEQFVYEASAFNAEGYRIAKRGFGSLREAKAFCENIGASVDRGDGQKQSEAWTL